MSGQESRSDRLGVDLILLIAAVLVADLVLLSGAFPWPVEWAVGIPLLVVVPGYALVSAVFPARPREADEDSVVGTAPDWPSRIGFAVVGSVLTVALVGIGLSWSVGIRLIPALLSLTVLTLVAAGVAAYRRARRSVYERANPLGAGIPFSLGLGEQSWGQRLALTVGIVMLLGAVAYAGGTPTASQPYSEASLLTENETTGELTATGYNRTYVAGQGHPLHVAITNHEGTTQTYTVVVRAKRVADNDTVAESERLDRFQMRVDQGEREVRTRTDAPTITGDRVQLQYLVYESAVPDDPRARNADLSMRLWVSVEPN